VPSMLNPAEIKQLDEWNETERSYQEDATLVSLLTEQAVATPDALALHYGQIRLSYREVEQRSNQLAHYLRLKGVSGETLVGVCMDRSIDMVISLLAIIKSGGAYVPMDPEYPAQRLQHMVEDAELKLLLSQREQQDVVDKLPVTAIMIEDIRTELNSLPTKAPEVNIKPEDLAYVIFTSGSTGRPKGVMNEHRGIVNRLKWMQDECPLNSDDRVLQKTPFSFDVSVWEFFWPLITGAKLIIAKPGGHRDTIYLAEAIKTHQITTMHFVPSMLQLFLQDTASAGCGSLKQVFCSGEALSYDLQRRFFMRLKNTGLHNLYGPTEAAIEVTYWNCERDTSSRTVPIGRPVANTKLYIVDANGNRAPLGVYGELWISGIQVARGYVRQPELTAERFIADPFSADSRVYRTGDLVRFREDGAIEFLGRIDHQVKLRGFRIELGEIESVLIKHPHVEQAIAVLRETKQRGQHLVAYITPAVGCEVDMAEIRECLKANLPDYMVPSAFMVLDAIPLTPNGKLDRKALPMPEYAAETEYVAPRDDTEKQLVDIWQVVLQQEKVGIHDDFFVLGGHSLLAMQLVSRIRDQLGFDLPVRRLFECPTIAGLAPDIADSVRGEEQMPIPAVEHSDGAPLSYAQKRLWFLEQMEPGDPVYHIPVPMLMKNGVDVTAFETSLSQLIARHESLRTVFRTIDAEAIQFVQPSMVLPLTVTDVPDTNPHSKAVQDVMLEISGKAFDFVNGPLVRANIIHLASGQSVFLLVIHHIVFDGWSINILMNELMALYKASLNGDALELPALPIQYADYAIWQNDLLQIDRLTPQVDFWREELRDAPALLALLTDRPRPAEQTHNGASISRVLAPQSVSVFAQLAQRQGCTQYMALMAAFSLLLARYSGQSDIIIGSPVAGRSHTELEGLIGFFINTVVVRTDLTGDPSYLELLERVRQRTLSAFEHQDVPFEKIVEELQPVRDLSHTPIFQVMFNLQNEPSDVAYAEKNGIANVGLTRVSSKFDLSASVIKTDGGYWTSFEYNTDLFDASTIEGMLDDFDALLNEVVMSPTRRISQLNLFANGPVPEILVPEVNVTKDTLVSGFENMVAANPDRLAVVSGDQHWTYAELNSCANAVAAELIILEDTAAPVGLLLGHDASMLAGLLGVLKSGRAYVPLDPSAPEERLRQLIEYGEISSLVIDNRYINLTNGINHNALPVIEISSAARTGHANPGFEISADSPAYVLFTSGSTGKPKGVMQTHRNVLYHADTYRDALKILPDDRLSLFSTYGFDASVMDIFGALLAGACLYPLDIRQEGSSQAVLQKLMDHRISIFHSTPTLYRFLFDQLGEQTLAAIRLVVLGGEEARPADFELFRRHCKKGALFMNGLGPTESTLALQYFADHATRLPGTVVPVGNAVNGCEVFLLDENGEATALQGEICIRSHFVTPGYWRDEVSTAAAFSYSPSKGVPVFRTGDLGRYAPGGEIIFVGRRDSQIKVRGHRVEPGEIEATLIEQTAVESCVVNLSDTLLGESYLVAYYVSHKDVAIESDVLRAFMHTRLPDYMVPAAYMQVDEIPLMRNGKLDRNALPVVTMQAAMHGYVAPKTSREKSLVTLWEEVLGREKIGIHDNFFELGGHSLLAITLVSRMRDKLDSTTKLRMMFNHPTIAGFADRLDSLGSSDGIGRALSKEVLLHPALMPVNLTGANPPLFCVYGEPALLASKLSKDRPVYSLNTAYGDGDIATAPSNIRDAARIYIEAIQSVQPTGPYFLYGHCSGATIAYEIAQLLQAEGHNVPHVCMLEPSLNAKGMKETAMMIIKGIRASGFSVTRFKALLSVTSVLLRLAPGVVRHKLRLLWHSKLGTTAEMELRLDSHLRKIVPSVRTYVYQELDCNISIGYRNLDDMQIGELDGFWGKVVGHKVKVYSVEAGAGHLAVLEAAPLETAASVIDASVEE
jgi:amino acid adenylation domain-containing protein